MDWPEDTAEEPGWDAARLAPALVQCEVSIRVSGDPPVDRKDTWRLEIATRDSGTARHHVLYRGPRVGQREAVEEAVLKNGVLATRTGGGPWLSRSDDERWRWLTGRPSADFVGLSARGQGAVLPTVLRDPETGVVTDARLQLDGDGWTAHYVYTVTRVSAPMQIPSVDAVSPDRDRSLPRRKRLLEELP